MIDGAAADELADRAATTPISTPMPKPTPIEVHGLARTTWSVYSHASLARCRTALSVSFSRSRAAFNVSSVSSCPGISCTLLGILSACIGSMIAPFGVVLTANQKKGAIDVPAEGNSESG